MALAKRWRVTHDALSPFGAFPIGEVTSKSGYSRLTRTAWSVVRRRRHETSGASNVPTGSLRYLAPRGRNRPAVALGDGGVCQNDSSVISSQEDRP